MFDTKLLILLAWSFFLSTSLAQAAGTDHQRVIHLKGSQNTRDIGGYVTEGGRQVRWGSIFRSDNLSRLKPEDFEKLEAMGLKTVIDLRTSKEVESAPTVWQGENAPQIFNYPVGESDGVWLRNQSQLLRKGRFRRQTMIDHFVSGYQAVPAVGRDSYQNLMRLVLDESNWPLLIHCTAGKDRTGIAVAMILEVLGVNRKTIMDDYLLTNEVARTQQQAEKLAAQQAKGRSTTGSYMNTLRQPGADDYFPLVGVTPEMLSGFYDGVEKEFGSMEAYFVLLGVDKTAGQALAQKLTAGVEK
jgi:protein-tyrosine phosphatase